MKFKVEKSEKIKGEIVVPGSKSHTIRGVVTSSFAEGKSILRNPLTSLDTEAVINGCSQLGAKIERFSDYWEITGMGGKAKKPTTTLNMMNSGTSTNLLTGLASTLNFEVKFDGDSSLRKRPMKPILSALEILGVKVEYLGEGGYPPYKITGPINGETTVVDGLNSQYLSSLLFATPLSKSDTEIKVNNLHEIPYVEMTLKWLEFLGIEYTKSDNLSKFKIKGNQSYKSYERDIPADWSSAAFPIILALISGEKLVISGPDYTDVQGDKRIVKILKDMGANIEIKESSLIVKKSKLKGIKMDLNSMPDSLPALAVISCFAEGETVIHNVAQARIKETDRISVMCEELKKMGADITEQEDGLTIKESKLHSAILNGHDDHRIVMSLSIAASSCDGVSEISTAESAAVTFPYFADKFRAVGVKINEIK